MTLYYILSFPLIICLIYYCVILLFPETYKETTFAKRPINLLIAISTFIYSIIVVVLCCFRNSELLSSKINMKMGLIFIPSIAVSLFVINIFCPAFCIMVSWKKHEKMIAMQLNRLIFQYKYQSDKRNEAINELTIFQETNKMFLSKWGIELYIPELINQSNNAVQLAPEKLINILEDYSIQLIKQISDYSPNPFTNSGIVFSFCISTLISLVLSYVSILP